MTKQTFIDACMTYLGLPYRWGGDDTILGYDCSGLAQELLAILGLDPKGDQTAQGLYYSLKLSCEPMSRLDTGTLVFFGSSNENITHVGVMIDSKTMIEAGGGNSKTTSEAMAASQNAYVRLRPYNRRSDIVAMLTPRGLPWV